MDIFLHGPSSGKWLVSDQPEGEGARLQAQARVDKVQRGIVPRTRKDHHGAALALRPGKQVKS
jgi:hypothetical protein